MKKLRRVRFLLVHCSASAFGTVEDVRAWHKARGWEDVGYHAVIPNGYAEKDGPYLRALDGTIQPGRPEAFQGAHCAAQSMNTRSLAVCLIGNPGETEYTGRQYYALLHWLKTNLKQYHLSPEDVFQHSDFEPKKPLCASLDMEAIRRWLKSMMLY